MPELLLINLGKGRTQGGPPYDEVTYVFEDGKDSFEVHTALAGLAIWSWLAHQGREPERVAFIATKEAWSTRRDFALAEAEKMKGIDLTRLDKEALESRLPRNMDDVWKDLEVIGTWCAQHSQGDTPVLHIDLTHSFRAIPLTQILLLRYLENRGEIQVGFLGYGVYTNTKDKRAPMLDLNTLMRTADWAAAVRDFRQRFDPTHLSELIAQEEKARRRTGILRTGSLSPEQKAAGAQIRAVVSAAQGAGKAFRAGLPLEIGLEVKRNAPQLSKLNPKNLTGAVPPPVAAMILELAETLKSLSLQCETEQKENVVLNHAEIERQLLLVRKWAELGDAANGLEALRELMVNRVLLARLGNGTEWLERHHRQAAEKALNACWDKSHELKTILTKTQQEIGKLWTEVINDRNSVAHAGMCKNRLDAGDAAHRLIKKYIPEFERLNQRAGDEWQLNGLENTVGKED